MSKAGPGIAEVASLGSFGLRACLSCLSCEQITLDLVLLLDSMTSPYTGLMCLL